MLRYQESIAEIADIIGYFNRSLTVIGIRQLAGLSK